MKEYNGLDETGATLELADVLRDLSGRRRHQEDTDKTLVLTLYSQNGELETLTVKRTHDMELFQEWLRRFDRYSGERI